MAGAIQTRNGKIITQGGKIVTDCGCCGAGCPYFCSGSTKDRIGVVTLPFDVEIGSCCYYGTTHRWTGSFYEEIDVWMKVHAWPSSYTFYIPPWSYAEGGCLFNHIFAHPDSTYWDGHPDKSDFDPDVFDVRMYLDEACTEPAINTSHPELGQVELYGFAIGFNTESFPYRPLDLLLFLYPLGDLYVETGADWYLYQDDFGDGWSLNTSTACCYTKTVVSDRPTTIGKDYSTYEYVWNEETETYDEIYHEDIRTYCYNPIRVNGPVSVCTIPDAMTMLSTKSAPNQKSNKPCGCGSNDKARLL